MLRLAEPASVPAMDQFMVAEGYLPRSRLCHRVTGCWCGSSNLEPRPAGRDPRFRFYQTCRDCGCLLLIHVLELSALAEL
jgi:hypothetical protein